MVNYGFLFILSFISVSIPLTLITILPAIGYDINLENLQVLADEYDVPFFPNWILDFFQFLDSIPFIGTGIITPILEFTLYPFFYLIHLMPFLSMILIPVYAGATIVLIFKLIQVLWLG